MTPVERALFERVTESLEGAAQELVQEFETGTNTTPCADLFVLVAEARAVIADSKAAETEAHKLLRLVEPLVGPLLVDDDQAAIEWRDTFRQLVGEYRYDAIRLACQELRALIGEDKDAV